VEIKKGEIVLVNLNPVIGSEQGKIRPALILQNNIGNKYSSTTIVAPMISNISHAQYPTNILIDSKESGLGYDSVVLLNQIRTIDNIRIIKKYKSISLYSQECVNNAVLISLGINN
jgi:mRNA interferase MazF